MTIRRLAGATAALVLLCSLAHATEIVVLVNGNRMDVKSYEIQSRVVIVTTWEDQVQSFPVAWVDIEATKNVSHQPTAGDGISPERLAHARRLLAAYGVRAGVSGWFEQLVGEIRSIKPQVSKPTYDVVRGAFRSAYNGDRIFDVVIADFATQANDELLDRWSSWMSRPEIVQILAMENAELTDTDEMDKSRYLAEFYSTPGSSGRTELVTRIDSALYASQIGLEIAVSLAESLQGAARLVLPNPRAEQNVDQLRQRFWPSVHKASVDSLLFSYRTASDEQLASYLAFWESDDGRRIAELTMTSIVAGARYGSEMAVRNVDAAVGGSIEQ